MKLYEILPRLNSHPIFRDTDPTLLDRYLNDTTMEISVFPPHTVAYSSISEGIRIGILLSGKAQAHTGVSEDRALLKTIGVSELFGVANLYAEEEPFPTQIVTVEESQILFIDGQAFKRFIENDPVALRNYLSFQSRKIVYLNRKIMTFTAGSAEKKLALFLLESESDGDVTPSCSMTELSELLGMGRASLYRAMDSLLQYGWIEKREKSIRILDRDALLHFV